ncbi:hypothetical protein SteCoe_9614 [Stentor coeruleus]|uniref:DUF3447 domain-containing protein n=1 Tax=Stentor coeruleus TaxID=5963 RepID=A0A1R2CHF8_9CILI|nr:hypothetical protein SteCoe_9614 [Stentor coeruleus]
MGACLVKKNVEQDTLLIKVQKIIENNDLLELEFISRTIDFSASIESIDKIYFTIKNLKANLLGLSLFYGSFDCFKFIHKTLNASLESMEKVFLEQKTSAIDLICTRNCIEILDYYLPHYEKSFEFCPLIEEVTESLNLTSNTEILKPKIFISTYTPIHKACEMGNINIISHIHKYFKEKTIIPYTLDLDYQDETSGENCSLISCRIGNYTMIRFLHKTCKTNFRLLNKLGENAIQILAASNKKKNFKDFYECLVYLVINVGVDLSHNYEETLLLLENEKSILFYQKKLKEKGIEIDKYELEEKNKLIRMKQVRSLEEEKLDSYQGSEFNFIQLYSDIMQGTDVEEISVIDTHSHNATPFTSVLNELPPN